METYCMKSQAREGQVPAAELPSVGRMGCVRNVHIQLHALRVKLCYFCCCTIKKKFPSITKQRRTCCCANI